MTGVVEQAQQVVSPEQITEERQRLLRQRIEKLDDVLKFGEVQYPEGLKMQLQAALDEEFFPGALEVHLREEKRSVIAQITRDGYLVDTVVLKAQVSYDKTSYTYGSQESAATIANSVHATVVDKIRKRFGKGAA